jgi:type IV pilus assembly protein PilC
MPEFQYQGVDRTGKKVTGVIQAQHEGELRVLLRSQGIRPTRVASVSLVHQDLGKLLSFGSQRVSSEKLVYFTRQLQVLIGSGIPIVQALDILHDQTSEPLKSICKGIKSRVSEGSYLWEALAGYPKVFPKLYTSLIRAGEASGAIDTMLKRLSRYLEDSERLKRTIKGALTYPVIVISIGIGVVILLLYFVIPKFEEMLSGAGQELPLPTQIVINISHFIQNYFYIIVALLVGGFITLKKFVQTDEGRALVDRITFRLPLFGELIQKAGVARFCRTLHTLITSGVTLNEAIDVCRTTIDNAVLETAVASIKPEIESGKSLSYAFGRLNVFPKMAAQMISVGESTGALDKMLEKISDFYEAEVEVAAQNMSKVIEPLLIVTLGFMIAGMLIAMYLPIFKLAGGVSE